MTDVNIEYCVVWNYKPRAAGLADELQKRFGLSTNLQKGKDGVFEVTFKDELIFSKSDLGRFPEPGEVESEVEKRVA